MAVARGQRWSNTYQKYVSSIPETFVLATIIHQLFPFVRSCWCFAFVLTLSPIMKVDSVHVSLQSL